MPVTLKGHKDQVKAIDCNSKYAVITKSVHDEKYLYIHKVCRILLITKFFVVLLTQNMI